jgi:hypothetical protein
MNHDEIRKVFDKHKTDKGRDHCYEHMYAAIFSTYDINSLLEIGVRDGRSISAWRDLFPNIQITGIDIAYNKKVKVDNNFEYIIYNSTDPRLKNLMFEEHDIIIDDGSHMCADQISTFNNLSGAFSKCYVIEDIHCSPRKHDSCDRIERAARDAGYTNIIKYDSCSVHGNTYAMVIYKK